MNYYTIATILSIITAVFTASAGWVTDVRKSFILQVFQVVIYAVASYFYGVYATIPVMLLCGGRNYLMAEGKFSVKMSIPFSIAVLALGLFFNNAGWKGYIPIIATVSYSVACGFCTKRLPNKINYIVNLFIWMIYDMSIMDFASLTMDTIGAIMGCTAAVKIISESKRAPLL